MTQNSTGKVWKIILVLILLLVVLSFLVPVLVTRYIKGKLIDVVEEKSQYHLEMKDLSLVGWDGVSATSITLIPKLDKETYNKENKYNSDWITVKVGRIEIQGLNWKSYLSNKKIWLDKLVIVEPDIYAYRDKRLADAPYKYKALVSQLLREAPINATVPLLEIKNGKVTYEEMPPKGGTALVVPFTELYGSVYDVSTDADYFVQHPIVLDAKGKILDVISTTMKYTSSTTDKDDKFVLEAHLGSFEASILNRYVGPQASAQITSGHVDSLWFKMEANDRLAEGVLHLGYHDLKITAKPKKKPKKFVELKSLISKLFVKEQNEVFKKEDLGHIHFERTKDRFIFNYIWGSFKSGVASVVINLPDKLIEKQLEKKKKKARK